VEGPTDDPEVNALRERQMRNFLGTLLLSQGVPMITAGDEFGRTQHGNNNAYCQDNEISWLNWDLSEFGQQLLDYTRRLVQIRNDHPVLHRRRFFQGRSIHGSGIHDIVWLRPDGLEMSDDEWDNGLVRCIGMLLNGNEMDDWNERGELVRDDILLLLLNAYHETVTFTLPGKFHSRKTRPWELLLDTSVAETWREGQSTKRLKAGEKYQLHGRSLVLLIQRMQH
jgi:glycogen operon protein